jgi:hypothetical protein
LLTKVKTWGEIKEARTAPQGSTNLMTDYQLAAEFKRHLQFQRDGKSQTRAVFALENMKKLRI